jgi:uncharacterized protein
MPYLRVAVNRFVRKLPLMLLLYLLFSACAGIAIAEISLKLYRRPIQHRAEAAEFVLRRYSAPLQEVSVTASDGAVLRAWYVHPRHFNGNTVLLLHGITDNREGMAGFARLFFDHGYGVLLPDARRHGESGGELATYGIKESGDIHDWVSWLYANDPPHCLYGLGESYGAALLLQSLAVEDRFCAVVAESSFSTARDMSYERISGPLHLRPWFGRTIGFPVREAAVLYAHWKYSTQSRTPPCPCCSSTVTMTQVSVLAIPSSSLQQLQIMFSCGSCQAPATPCHGLQPIRSSNRAFWDGSLSTSGLLRVLQAVLSHPLREHTESS